ncbi:MAG: PilZ domain-containing protein [Proteobacteria bacterium]|nr:PilZ domain-containing protein [Pseudomonadota bacterium]
MGLKSLLGGSDDKFSTERRADARRKVLLSAEVHPVARYVSARVENVSRTGLMIACDEELKVEQVVALNVEGEGFHMATVRWARGQRYGLRLQGALLVFGFDEEELEAGEGGEQARERRHEIDAAARLAILAPPQKGIIRDVSQSGLQIEGEFSFAEGDDVMVEPKGRPLIHGQVRWSDGAKMGIHATQRMAILRMVYSYD